MTSTAPLPALWVSLIAKDISLREIHAVHVFDNLITPRGYNQLQAHSPALAEQQNRCVAGETLRRTSDLHAWNMELCCRSRMASSWCFGSMIIARS